MRKKLKDINSKVMKLTSILVIAGSVSLVSNTEVVNANPNINAKEITQINESKENDGWNTEDSKWYYYENGVKKTGWLKDNNQWYYLKSDGVMSSNEWVNLDGTWYRFYQGGTMCSNEWYKNEDGVWYWLKSSGAMSANEWVDIKGSWHRFYQSGAMYSNEWYKNSNGAWYWLKSNGYMASNEWVDVKGSWYRFYQSGIMYSNEWYINDSGTTYWLKPNGVMASNELIEIDKKWYKFHQSGSSDVKKHEQVAKINECDYLNIRSGPNSNDEVLGRVYTGEYVEVLEQGSTGWYKIQSNDKIIGWVNSKYLTVQTDSNIDSRIEKVIDVARKQLGKPYVWGASGPDSFDCSGFTYYAYKQGANVTLPRVSRDQAKYGTSVARENLKAGDLVFFASNGDTINHVALYIGNSEYIHAPQTGDVVKIDKTSSSYFNKNYHSVRRVIN